VRAAPFEETVLADEVDVEVSPADGAVESRRWAMVMRLSNRPAWGQGQTITPRTSSQRTRMLSLMLYHDSSGVRRRLSVRPCVGQPVAECSPALRESAGLPL